jgi:NagD protein
MAKGAQLITAGARFIGSNPDKTIPVEQGVYPACGAACALIETATGVRPYFLGKPNPFMMRSALDRLNVRAADSIMVGDRLDTDIIAGMELGLRTALVLTGASTRDELVHYPYGPDIIVDRLFDLSKTFSIG